MKASHSFDCLTHCKPNVKWTVYKIHEKKKEKKIRKKYNCFPFNVLLKELTKMPLQLETVRNLTMFERRQPLSALEQIL